MRLWILMLPLFLLLASCTVTGKKSDVGKLGEAFEGGRSGTVSEVENFEGPAPDQSRTDYGKNNIFHNYYYLSEDVVTDENATGFIGPKKSISQVKKNRQINKTSEANLEAKSKESWKITEVSGFYWILLGLGILIISIAFGVVVLVCIVAVVAYFIFRAWNKMQGEGIITFLKDMLGGLTPGTDAAKAVDTMKAWVRSKYNLR